MDRNTWMYKIKRNTIEYLRGIDEFLECASEDMRNRGARTLVCPCEDCQNLRRFGNIKQVRDHLIRRGFMDRYTRWVRHGENIETENSRNYENIVRDESEGDDLNLDNDEWDVLENENVRNTENIDNVESEQLDEIMNDIAADFVDIPEIFKNLGNDSNVPLFPGCTKFTKISAVFKLYNLKAKNGWSDKSFTSLLELLREMLPENNLIPDSTYRAKKLLCPLSMEVERIHACPNDCILYRNEYNDLDKCPKCNASRYKPRDNEIEVRKRPAAKVLWYLPVIPRFQRLFANSKDAHLLRWHVDGRKDDGMLRHPGDSPEWRNINRIFKDFGDELRNLRLGLCTDGMNPYGLMSSGNTTWPVLLCIYNLPPGYA
jgi:Transposase family tnp2/Transposase-associated domain